MSSTTTKTIEHLALDGPIGAAAAIVLGAALLGLFAWALWREQHVLGRRNMLLFWLLRSAALAAVLWMLLAPTNVRVQTATTRRAVAIVTDVSGSMQTVDPAGTSDDLRWAMARSESDQHVAVPAADRAIAALGMAQRSLQRATQALRQHKPEGTVVEAASSANDAIQRAKSHLRDLSFRRSASERTGLADAESKTRSLARSLASDLDGPEFQAFDRLCTALQKERAPSQTGWRESLPDLDYRLAGIRASCRELARRVAVDESSRLARENPGMLTSVRKASRLARTASFVERLQQSMPSSIRERADVRWTAFDQTVHRLNDPISPRQRLGAFVARNPDSLRSRVSAATPPATTGTDISAVLDHLHRERQDQPLAAVFLLSDMAHNQPGETPPRDVAATLSETPVYVVPIGNPQHVRDVTLQAVSAPSVAMRNDDIVIEVSLQAYDCEGAVCSVQLLQDGDVIDFREVVLDSGFASRAVRFERRMRSVGTETFQVAIVPLQGELTEENNYDAFDVTVTRSDIAVLLADELPRWEYRYLAQLFRRDPKVECDELLYRPRMIATGRREETQTVPITVDEWDQYDVVLLGDLPTQHFPVAAQESLIEYLKQHGGTLVLIAGREAMPQEYVNHPLQEILPVSPVDDRSARNPNPSPIGRGAGGAGPAGYAFRVTDEGRDHDALMIGETDEETRAAWDFVNRFSPLHEISAWRRPRPSARTLIAAVPRNTGQPPMRNPASARSRVSGDIDAFLCWQPVGRGRIVYLSGPDTYRLRFLRGDRLHYRFWGQLLRWAIASELAAGTEFVRIRTDKTRYRPTEAVHATVRLQDADGEPVAAENLEVRITSGDNERTVPLVPSAEIPGEYTAEVRSLPPGVYRIEPVGAAIQALPTDSTQQPAKASFTVQAHRPQELVDTRCDRALAQQIADVTGGQVLPPTAVEEILELTNLEPIVTERMERRPLWLQWKYLLLVFGCLQTEWIIRKWKGLS